MTPLIYLTYPLAWPYALVVAIRNLLFDKGAIKSLRPQIPCISVGNLTAGGTGKTPHAEYLLRLLSPKFEVAELSRGHKRKSKGYLEAGPDSTAAELGDEALQISRKFPDVVVAVDKDRREGIARLMQNHPGLRAVILDDAYQHRYVTPGLSILLCDFGRPYYSDRVLPYGMLREPKSGAKRADIIIVTKCPADLTPEERERRIRLIGPREQQKVFFSTLRYGTPYGLRSGEPLAEGTRSILAVTAIARPAPLYEHLAKLGTLHALEFADHHFFTAADIEKISRRFSRIEGDKIIMVSEKDAAKLRGCESLTEDMARMIYVQPVEAAIIFGQEQEFNETISAYVQADTRNGGLSQS